jgi:hypothetical protein
MVTTAVRSPTLSRSNTGNPVPPPNATTVRSSCPPIRFSISSTDSNRSKDEGRSDPLPNRCRDARTCSPRTCLRRSVAAAAYPSVPFLWVPHVCARPDRMRFSFLQSWNWCRRTVATIPSLSGSPSPLPRLRVLSAWRLPGSPSLLPPSHAHGFHESPRVLDDLAAGATSDRRRG